MLLARWHDKEIASLTELQVLEGFVVGDLESNINNNLQGPPPQFLDGMCSLKRETHVLLIIW